MEDKKGKRCLNNMNFVLMQILSMIMTVVMIRIRYSSALPSMKRVPQYRADIIAVLLGSFEVFIDQHYNGRYMQQPASSCSKHNLDYQLVLSCLDSLHEFLHPVAAHKVFVFVYSYSTHGISVAYVFNA